MALSADRYLDMSRAGTYGKEYPAHAVGTFYKGAAGVFRGGRLDLQGGAQRVFAGFVEKQTVVTAQGQMVPVRIPTRVELPDTSATLANRGQMCDLVTDDEGLAYRDVGAVLTSNGTQLGLVMDVEVGVSVTVEVARTWVEA